ncbi:hypothetical protein [Tautonia plasticadhaerens]|uniref:Ribbon-helix-helix protein CopG domain-containing protein n=1 Tax=Tautonia plasticadhaerens TaxID=2527974 RepID=A0A518H0Q0_9BACT|nr:hypothetical protein [Tautonia plasticadhaerens]QDV34424.1 hypothetical protein ElP_23100 [Tautonia plasticadhaerens]
MDEAKRGRGRPPAENPRSKFVKIRARPEWADWLRDIAEQSGRDAADIIGEALESWAKRKKLPAPPER